MQPDTAQPPPAAIELRVNDGIATLLLNRPQVRNAIDDAMRAELVALLDRIARDDAIRAVVVTGQGPAFCAGGDIKGMRARMAAPPGEVAINGWRRQQRTHHAITALHTLPKPTVAAANGAATGLGCDLALACDFVMAAETATLAMSYIHRGLIPDGGGMYFLPRRIGLTKAKELIFTGRRLDSAEMLSLGVADRMVPHVDLIPAAIQWAGELTQHSATALGLAKSIMNGAFEHTLEDTLAAGAQAQAIAYTTDAHHASVEAFLERSRRRARSQQE